MLGTLPLRILLSAIVLFIFAVRYCTRGHAFLPVQNHESSTSLPTPSPQPIPPLYQDIRNSTLGFQDVFVLNLASRTDKLDMFTLSSTMTDFDFKVLPGVEGRSISNKALCCDVGFPSDIHHFEREVGSWRAHLNFAHHIVKNRLATAVLFEDDADWDVDLKSQLELVAQGTRSLSASPKSFDPYSETATERNNTVEAVPHSPYGDDWDLLWLGHCGAQLHKGSDQVFRIDNDPTVAPPNHRTSFKSSVDMSDYPDSTRLVFRQGRGLCVYSYALSFRGAQKLLLNENNRKRFNSFDTSLDLLCSSGSRKNGANQQGGWQADFKCLSVYPTIVDSHKAPGMTSRDSDINSGVDEYRDYGYTFNIVRSVRINLQRLVTWGGWEAMRREGDAAAAELKLQWDWEDQPPVTEEIRMGLEPVGELEPVKGMFD